MNKLTGPISIIQKSVTLFFEKENLTYFLTVFSVPFVLSIASSAFQYYLTRLGYSETNVLGEFTSGNRLIASLTLLWWIISFLIGIWAQAAGYESVKRVVKKGSFNFKNTYKAAWKYLGRFFIVNLLLALLIGIGAILLIVPGIIFWTWYVFSGWGVVDKNYGIKEAFSKSKALVKGKFWAVLGRISVFMLFSILVQLVFSSVPNGYGTILLSILSAVLLLPTFLLYRELAEH